MSHDKGKTVEELGGGLDSAEAQLARLRDEIRVSESDATRKAYNDMSEAIRSALRYIG
jgi:hypothetical protein